MQKYLYSLVFIIFLTSSVYAYQTTFYIENDCPYREGFTISVVPSSNKCQVANHQVDVPYKGKSLAISLSGDTNCQFSVYIPESPHETYHKAPAINFPSEGTIGVIKCKNRGWYGPCICDK